MDLLAEGLVSLVKTRIVMNKFLAFLLSCCFCGSFAEQPKIRFYIGTTDKSPQSSIVLAELDPSTTTISFLDSLIVAPGPGYLAVAPGKKHLYAVTQDNQVRSFAMDRSGGLKFLNSVPSEGINPCHVSVHPSGKMVFAANYTGGSFTAFSLNASGTIGDKIYHEQYIGSGPNQRRQDKSHAHCAISGLKGNYLYLADLGTDRIMNYKIDASKGTVIPNPKQPYFSVRPGMGPRHLVVHPSGKWLFLLNELTAELMACAVSDQGVISEIKTYPTIPADFKGNNSSAAIRLHPNGKWVYVSNRGHDSISAFRVKTSGELEEIDTQTNQIDTPRDFNIDPSGRFLIAGNQGTNDLTVYSIDPASGKMKLMVAGIKIKNPTCIAFL